MKRYLAVLRGINVSGQKIIKMEALRTAMEALGFQNIKTYIQSGNLVFENPESDTETLEKAIHQQILTHFGFEVPVLVLEKAEMDKILTENPYFSDDKDPKQLHVTLLKAEAAAEKVAQLNPDAYLPDTFSITGKTIYLYTPGGYGNTKLSNTFFENKLKTPATTRNWKTMQELHKMITN